MKREEAIKIVREFLNGTCLRMQYQEAFETLIPELAKSEDERIREGLCDIVEYMPYMETELRARGLTVEKTIAYLEKQKEQTEDLSTRLNGVMQEYVKAGKDEEEQEHRLKCYQLFWDALGDSEFFKQKEQKPVDDGTRAKIISRATSEKQVVLVSESDGNAEIGWDTRSLEDARNLLEYGILFINKQLGVKPTEWSKEDKYILKNIHDFVKENTINPNRVNCAKECLNWLNSLPERFNLRPRQEWGEEDEKMIGFITNPQYNSDMVDLLVSELQAIAKNNGTLKQYDAEISWLKSLPLSLKKKNEDITKLCSNEWSDEEIGHLYTLASYIKSKGYEDDGEFLEGVANKLKSIRPQPKQEWNEEDEKFFKAALWHIGYSASNGKTTDMHCETTDWLKGIKERLKSIHPQPKKEWSEEDEDYLTDVKCAIYDYFDEGNAEDLYNWLKSLPERFNLKPKQEWSEEDEKILDELLDHCNTKNATWYNWLKSLPQRFNLQSKPEKEIVEEKEFNEVYQQWFNEVYMKKFPDLIDTAQYFYNLRKNKDTNY